MATRVTQVVKTIITEYPSTARITQVVKITIATVAPQGSNTGLRTLGMGS